MQMSPTHSSLAQRFPLLNNCTCNIIALAAMYLAHRCAGRTGAQSLTSQFWSGLDHAAQPSHLCRSTAGRGRAEQGWAGLGLFGPYLVCQPGSYTVLTASVAAAVLSAQAPLDSLPALVIQLRHHCLGVLCEGTARRGRVLGRAGQGWLGFGQVLRRAREPLQIRCHIA